MLRRGFALLCRERSLWPLAVLPLASNLAAFALAIWAFAAHLDAIAAPLERALDPGEPEAWWGWAWAGPLLVLALLARWLLLAALGVAIYFLFTVLGGVIAAPFLERLSERVERIATGAPAPSVPGLAAFARGAIRSIVYESKRAAFFVSVQLGLVLLGFIPGAQPIAAAASLAFTALFLPLDYTAHALDRRSVSFRLRRRWILAHPAEMLGFGGLGLVLFFVPGLSFLCLPWLVTSGTLLALELGPPQERPPAS